MHAQETGWQSDMQSFIMPTHLVQELNVGTISLMVCGLQILTKCSLEYPLFPRMILEQV